MKRYYFIKTAAAVIAAAVCTAGCSSGNPDDDIISTGGKTEVTMMYTSGLSNFEEFIEDACPDIDLIIERSTVATINGDSERRLKKGHGTDLIITTIPTGEVRKYAADLSAEEFSGAYYSTVRTNVTFDGLVMFLPLPGQYEGYILNTTLAGELGFDIPDSNTELEELLAAAKEQGVGVGDDGAVFGLEDMDESAFGSFIIGTRIPDFLGLADGAVWRSQLDSNTASFSGVWDNCMDRILDWSEKGFINREVSSYKSNAIPVAERMENGKMILAYGKSGTLTALNKSEKYEYAMLPLMSDEGNKPWTMSVPDAYIGINASVTDTEKEDACIRILELLSTEEGQNAWIADTEANTSYLTEYKNDPVSPPKGLEDCINDGYVYNLKMAPNIVFYFGRLMSEVFSGSTEMSEALAKVDDYCINGSAEVDADLIVAGSVPGDMLYENYNVRLVETAVGNLVADAMAEAAGTNIAFANGGAIRAGIYAGDVLVSDIQAMCPYDNHIISVEGKGSVIYEMLENSISMQVTESGIPSGRFLQVSGINYSFRPMTKDSPPRLLSVTLEDGTALDKEKTYTFAVTDYMAGIGGYIENNGDGYTMLNIYSDADEKGDVTLVKETGLTFKDALVDYFSRHGAEEISCELQRRIHIVVG